DARGPGPSRSLVCAFPGAGSYLYYTFKHALVQDAAYASLLRDRRRGIHSRIAEMLEKDTAGPAVTEPQLLAWHFAQAGAPDKSIDYYLKAAERARELCLALGDTKQLVPVFDGLVLNYHFAHSEPRKMLSYATELLELGQKAEDEQALLWAR